MSCFLGKKEKTFPTLITIEEVASLPKEDLSSNEVEVLYKVILQEYLTKNVYYQVSTQFTNEEPFLTAYNEEEKVLQLLSSLLSKYMLTLPGDDTMAESQEYIRKIRFQIDACEVGSKLEFAKYTLYDELLKNVDNQDIQKVFFSILNTSVEKNMKLFENCSE
jgi:rubrerythrin